MTDISNSDTLHMKIFEELTNIFSSPDTQVRFFSKYHYFNSETLKSWISDYYKLQSRLIQESYYSLNGEEIVVNVPCYNSSINWSRKSIYNTITFDWCSFHQGVIDLNHNALQGIFYRLKSLYEHEKEVFNAIIPTKFDLEFNKKCQIIIKGLSDKRHLDVRSIRNFFIGFQNEQECVKHIQSYMKKIHYVTIDELGTEMMYISDCIYGFSMFMMRCGLDLEKDVEALKLELPETSADKTAKLIIEELCKEDEDDDDDDKEDEYGFYLDESKHLIKDFNIYAPNQYYTNDTEKRQLVMKIYGDNAYNLFQEFDGDNPPEYIERFDDFKELAAMLYFGTNEEKLDEFFRKYRDTNQLHIFRSIAEVEDCCKKLENDIPYEVPEKIIATEHKDIIRDIFSIGFNDHHNFTAQKIIEIHKSKFEAEAKNEIISTISEKTTENKKIETEKPKKKRGRTKKNKTKE